MRMIYAENTLPINEVIENIKLLYGDKLGRNCIKIELELRANVGLYKYLINDIWDEIWLKLYYQAMNSSTCERWYTDKNIADGMCKYFIKIFYMDWNDPAYIDINCFI